MPKSYSFTQISTASTKKTLLKSLIHKRGASTQKVEQMLSKSKSISYGSNDKEYNFALQTIQNESPQLFKQIDKFSKNYMIGSIANVHQAVLEDGNIVAIKVLREKIEDKIQNDFKTSNMFTKSFSKFFNADKFNNLNEFSSSFIKEILFECNLVDEDKNNKVFKRQTERLKIVKIAHVYTEFTSKSILVSKWYKESHNAIEHLLREDQQKVKILDELNYLFIQRPLISGIIQEDTNLGNFLLNDNNIILIDFGKTYTIPLNLRLGIAYTINELIHSKTINYIYCAKLLGYKIDNLEPIKDLLGSIINILFEPFTKDNLNLNDWSPTERINNILADNKWILRSSGSYEFFKVTRSLIGYYKFLTLLNLNISSKQYLKDVLDLYEADFKILKDREPRDKCVNKYDPKKKNIQILVIKSGIEKARVTLPINALINFEDLTTKEIQKDIARKNISIPEIIQKGLSNNESTELYRYEDQNETLIMRLICNN